MPKIITLTLTDDQVSSLEKFIRLPQFVPWSYSEKTKQNEPVPEFPTVESFISSRWTDLIHTAVKECPVDHVQEKLDKIKALQEEISATARPAIKSEDE